MSRPALAFCVLDKPRCRLQELLAASVELCNGIAKQPESSDAFSLQEESANNNPLIAARLLRGQRNNELVEVWLRISGDSAVLRVFEQALRMEEGLRFQVLFENGFNKVVRIVLPRSKCIHSWCPLFEIPMGIMAKSIILTPDYMLLEVIAVKRSLLKKLEDKGCRIVRLGSISGMDYMLTPRQEQMLIYAFEKGYYSFPRRIGLAELARELGLSVSTLSELIRRAEGKVVKAFMIHELPHYLCNPTLMASVKSKGTREKRYRRAGKPSQSLGSRLL